MENRNGKLILSTKGLRVGVIVGLLSVVALLVMGNYVLDNPVSFGKDFTNNVFKMKDTGVEIGIAIMSAILFGTTLNMARAHLNVYENAIEGVAVKDFLGKFYYSTEKFFVPYSKISTVSDDGMIGDKCIIVRTKDGASYKIPCPNKYIGQAVEEIRSRISDN